VTKLWGKYRIPIIGLAGEPSSGKTLWGLMVDENCFNRDVEATTVVWDVEGSSETYQDTLNFTRIDIPKLAAKRRRGYTTLDMFEVWLESSLEMSTGHFHVGMLDTIAEIENGLVQYIGARPGNYGYTAKQFMKGGGYGGGIFWGVVKSEWKRMLMTAGMKFQTFILTMHMRSEFSSSGKPTGRRIPMGKETIMDITSLYMTLVRDIKPGVAHVNLPPKGLCQYPAGKSRLMGLNSMGKIQDLLPPVIPDASPAGIRTYLDSPPDFSNLLPEEQALPEVVISASQKLAIQADIAELENERAQADLARAEIEKEIKNEVKYMVLDSEALKRLKSKVLSKVSLEDAKAILNTRYAVGKLGQLTFAQAADLEVHIDSLGN